MLPTTDSYLFIYYQIFFNFLILTIIRCTISPYSLGVFYAHYLLLDRYIFYLLLCTYVRYRYIYKDTPMPTQNISIESLPDLLTVREVAQLLRVSPLTIKRWGKRGKLPAIRINSRGDRRYKKEAVLYLLGIQQKSNS